MSKTVTTTITVTTVGDGDNSSDTFTFTNPAGVPPTSVLVPGTGSATIGIPAGIPGAHIVVPAGSAIILKGVSGDTGNPITPGGFATIFFSVGQATFVLAQSGGSPQTATILWL